MKSTNRSHPRATRSRSRGSLLPVTCLVAAALAIPALAQDASQTMAAAAGKKTFNVYCASCHGTDASGEGPMTQALAFKPRDLKLLAKREDGVFPAERVAKVIDGTDKVVGHGSRDMPVWGPIFQAQYEGAGGRNAEERIAELVAYLESIQQSPPGDEKVGDEKAGDEKAGDEETGEPQR